MPESKGIKNVQKKSKVGIYTVSKEDTLLTRALFQAKDLDLATDICKKLQSSPYCPRHLRSVPLLDMYMLLTDGHNAGLSIRQSMEGIIPYTDGGLYMKGDTALYLVKTKMNLRIWDVIKTGSVDLGNYEVRILSAVEGRDEVYESIYDQDQAMRAGLMGKHLNKSSYANRYSERTIYYRCLGFHVRTYYIECIGDFHIYEEIKSDKERNKLTPVTRSQIMNEEMDKFLK